MPDTDGWLKILKVPVFNMCAECPLVKMIEGLMKIVPASPEAEEAFRIIKGGVHKKESASDSFDRDNSFAKRKGMNNG